ncbi:hypothetical protein ES703_86528 [subsurface metagenome]
MLPLIPCENCHACIYFFAVGLKGEATVKAGTCASVLVVVLAVLAAQTSACVSAPVPEGNQPPVISSLEAKYMAVDPRAASEIRCLASDPDGDEVEFKWSCTGGNLSGAGPVVTWRAPNSYGDYHVMVIAKDTNGGSTQAILTLSVVARPASRGCCGR